MLLGGYRSAFGAGLTPDKASSLDAWREIILLYKQDIGRSTGASGWGEAGSQALLVLLSER